MELRRRVGPQRGHRVEVLVGADAPAFEAVASGLGVVLLAAGNAAIYHRADVAFRPVPDLPPCELAVLWRRADRRTAVRVVTEATCRCVAADALP